MANYDLIATSAMGLEALVAKEVRELGYECKVEMVVFFFKEMKRQLRKVICG